MNSLLNLVALAAVQALFLLLGLGITARVRPLCRSGWAIALAPVVGHLALIVFALGLATRFAAGGPAVLAAAGILLAVTASAARAVREASARFARSRAMRTLTVLALAVQLLNSAGLVASGVATYNGNANLDAWYYAMDTDLLQSRRYFEPLAPEPLRPLLHTIPPVTRVGAEWSVLLVAEVFPLGVVPAFNLTLASFLPLVCVAAAYFAREGIRLPWRWALLAAGLAGIHSSLSLAYLNQHLGQVLSLAVAPIAVTSASRCRRDTASAAVAGLIASAALFAYWPTAPLVAIPIVLVAGAHAWRRSLEPRMVAAFVATAIAVVVLGSPVVVIDSLGAVAHARRTASRNDPALLAFNPYLTEELLPLAAGVVHPGAFTGWRLVEGPKPAPRAYASMAVHHAIALAVIALALAGVASQIRRRRPLLPAALGTAVVLMAAMVHGEYGYGAYKLVSWMHVAFVVAFVAGAQYAWSARRSRTWRMAAATVIVLCAAFNLRLTGSRVLASVVAQPDTYLAGPLFARNPDWQDLERWSAAAPGPVLVGLHPHVAQYWASFRLRRSGYAFLVPQDTLGASGASEQAHHATLKDVPDDLPPLTLDPQAVSACPLFLDWAGPIDIARNVPPTTPVARDATFALYRMDDVTEFLSVREGWYGVEALDPAGRGTSTFRWMSPRASLLLFRFPAQLIRLVLGVQSGVGLPTLDRRVTVRHRGQPLATFDVEGSARLATPPFVPDTPFDEIVLEVAGAPRPMPRALTLWNRWALHDPRPLALGVSDVQARRVGEAAGSDGAFARRWRPREIRAQLLYDGLHADDWMGRRFVVTVPGGALGARLALDGLSEQQPVRVTVDGGAARVVDLQPSLLQTVDLELTESPDGDGHVIALEFTRWREEATTSQLGLDRRREAARLLWLDLR